MSCERDEALRRFPPANVQKLIPMPMTIPKSTEHRVFRVSDGKLVFAGNKKDALREFKRLGGTKAGYRLFLTRSETMPGLVVPQIQRSTLPEPLARQIRIELRKLPAWKLKEAYDKLRKGEPTGTDIVERNRAHALNAIAEILWERGKLSTSELKQLS